jgi:hypothetical protein
MNYYCFMFSIFVLYFLRFAIHDGSHHQQQIHLCRDSNFLFFSSLSHSTSDKADPAHIDIIDDDDCLGSVFRHCL